VLPGLFGKKKVKSPMAWILVACGLREGQTFTGNRAGKLDDSGLLLAHNGRRAFHVIDWLKRQPLGGGWERCAWSSIVHGLAHASTAKAERVTKPLLRLPPAQTLGIGTRQFAGRGEFRTVEVLQ